MTGIELITEERRRQIAEEGWDEAHDDNHQPQDALACAGASYALPQRLRPVLGRVPTSWPWDSEWWKPTPDNRVRELVKAGALIAAEIDRIQRAS